MNPISRTWRILPDSEKGFRWNVSDQDPNPTHEEHNRTLTLQRNPSSSLPSMYDLLLEGYSRICSDGGTSDSAPMFRTGSGKSVTVKRSSIRKALSVVGDGNDEDAPMFRTGLGKPVAVKESSIKKALAVIGGGDDVDVPMFWSGSAKADAVEGSLAGEAVPDFGDGSDDRAPIFRTGSGKSVTVKESSTRKALARFVDQSNGASAVPMFQTGSGKAVSLKEQSMKKAIDILGEGEILKRDQHATDQICGYSSSIFEIGSGRKLDVSSAGLVRAKTLLGLGENYKLGTYQCHEDTAEQSVSNGLGNLQYMENVVRESHQATGMHNNGPSSASSIPKFSSHCQRDKSLSTNELANNAFSNFLGPDVCKSSSKQPPVKFQTAGGRSVTVSSHALQRARSLLGDVELGELPNELTTYDPMVSHFKEGETCKDAPLNKENIPHALPHQNEDRNKHPVNGFPHKIGSFVKQRQLSSLTEIACSRGEMNCADANDFVSKGLCGSDNTSRMQEPSSANIHSTHTVVKSSFQKDLASGAVLRGNSPGGSLVDFSNNVEMSHANKKHIVCEKRKLGRRSSISPFKRPRSLWFPNPSNGSISFPSEGSYIQPTSEDFRCKKKVSTRYPFQVTRKTIKEFFGGPPNHCNSLGHLPDEIRCMSANSAQRYKFHAVPDSAGIGADAFQDLLVQSGTSLLHATKEWVANHYKWIVWKLACLDRGYPAQASGKYLTVSNVLEELKYRYEREVNHGHRSSVKRILEGDASPASVMVLCISAIHSCLDPNLDKMECPLPPYEDCKRLNVPNGVEKTHLLKIELTDGWYSLDAVLDAPLSRQLVSGKLFVGQKLRILGAGLRGWAGPISPLEDSRMISLLLHINGTYRAHWADRLGFCRSIGAPLAFSCIKCDGGPVPRTLAGVTRIYPIMYKERFADGRTVVRSERIETETFQLYNQRRSIIADGIISEMQKDVFGFSTKIHSDSEEGARISNLLETAAEPEVLMADMSSEQLTSFANYKAKQEEVKQSDMLKKIEKALDDAGLSGREVTPLMRVRIVGLTSRYSQRKGCPREGLVTIWNPTEKQVTDLAEGKIYRIGGLVPLNMHSNIIYLQTRGCTNTWQSLPPSAIERFEQFFTPRKAVSLSNLGEVPLTSEFDMAAVIVYVGDVYVTGQRKKQWVFVTDGSMSGSDLQMEGLSNCLVAVCFCSSIMENDSITPFSHNLAGSIVCFCNLVKQARDQVNHLWVAEATENSTYFISTDLHGCIYLKEAANSACKWAAISSMTIQKLRERVLCIIGLHSR